MRYRPYADQRTHEEKEVENCTFKPEINAGVPFVSERTLRRLAEQRRLRAPPPPPQPIASEHHPLLQGLLMKSTNKDTGEKPFAGMFKRGQGLLKGPPSSANLPMFYFDPFNPPNFITGMYGNSPVPVSIVNKTKEIENPSNEPDKVEISSPISQSLGLKAPPLPPWISEAKAAAAPTSKINRIVIDKSKSESKKKEDSGGGWNSILAEMQKKAAARNGRTIEDPILKKKEAAPPPKKLGGKKGKKNFTDVMGELNYKLAKLRGEIPESDEDVEEESSPPPPTSNSSPPPPPPPKVNAPPPPTEPSVEPKKKIQASSALANLFAKKSSAPVAADDKPKTLPPPPKTTGSIPVKIPQPPISGPYTNGPSNGAPICTPPPTIVLAAPKLPSSWPPVPTTEVVKLNSATKTIKPVAINPMGSIADALKQKFKKNENNSEEDKKKLRIDVNEVTTTIQGVPTKPLPEGYYIAATKEGKVEPFDILPAGMVSEDILAHYIELFQINKSKVEDKFEQSIGRGTPLKIDKKADPYELDQTSQSILSYIYRAHRDCETELDVSNKLTQHDLPVPSSYHSTIERFRRGNKKREEQRELEKKLEYRNYEEQSGSSDLVNTSPYGVRISQTLSLMNSQAPNFETTKRIDEKSYTFRKSSETTQIDFLPQDETIRSSYYMDIDNYNASNGPTSHWMNSLRSSSTKRSRSAERSTSRSRSLGRCESKELEKELCWNPRVVSTTNVLPASLECLAKPLKDQISRSRTPNKTRSSDESSFWNKSLGHSTPLFSPTPRLTVSALENSFSKSNSVSSNFGKTILKLSDSSRAPRLLSEEAAERRIANKELRELDERNRQAEIQLREKERRQRLKNQAFRVGAEVKAYKEANYVPPPLPSMTTTSCSINVSISPPSYSPSSPLPLNRTSQYHLKMAQKYSNIPGGNKLVTLTENAYQNYAGHSIYNSYRNDQADNLSFYHEDSKESPMNRDNYLYPTYTSFDENENFDLRMNNNVTSDLDREYDDYNLTYSSFSPHPHQTPFSQPVYNHSNSYYDNRNPSPVSHALPTYPQTDTLMYDSQANRYASQPSFSPNPYQRGYSYTEEDEDEILSQYE